MRNESITEQIIEICYEKNIPISRLEKEVGFANGYLSKHSGNDFPFKRLVKVCDYLKIPIWYFDESLEEDVKRRLLKVLI